MLEPIIGATGKKNGLTNGRGKQTSSRSKKLKPSVLKRIAKTGEQNGNANPWRNPKRTNRRPKKENGGRGGKRRTTLPKPVGAVRAAGLVGGKGRTTLPKPVGALRTAGLVGTKFGRNITTPGRTPIQCGGPAGWTPTPAGGEDTPRTGCPLKLWGTPPPPEICTVTPPPCAWADRAKSSARTPTVSAVFMRVPDLGRSIPQSAALRAIEQDRSRLLWISAGWWRMLPGNLAYHFICWSAGSGAR